MKKIYNSHTDSSYIPWYIRINLDLLSNGISSIMIVIIIPFKFSILYITEENSRVG